MKNFWKIALAIAIVYILYLSVCNRQPTDTPDYENQNKLLVQKVKQDSINRLLEHARFDSIIKLSGEKHITLVSKLDKSEIKLYQSQGTINRLITQLNNAKLKPIDSTFVFASPEYIEACDSLAIVSVIQGTQLREAKEDKDNLVDLMNYEVVIRDSAIEDERMRYDSLQADFNAQTHFFNLAVKEGKARTKVYAGIAALGNNEHPFGGGEINFTLQTKKDKMFDIATGFLNDQWYARVGYKNKLSLKK